jgi:tetratricopeptide (TPR) repeat protein
LKRGKDEFLTKLNLQTTGAEVANELRGKSWEERYQWINQAKEKGNKMVKEDKIEAAIDEYMRALCGMDFSSYSIKEDNGEQKERDTRVKRELKAPILNNIALCLIKQGKIQRANTMLDLVLEADPTNNKAWQRKIQNLISLA